MDRISVVHFEWSSENRAVVRWINLAVTTALKEDNKKGLL